MKGLPVLLAAVTAGCGGGRQAAWETTPVTSTRQQSAEAQSRREALVAEGTAAFEQRGTEEQIRSCIAKWEQSLEIDPTDHELWARLSRAYYFLADGHLSFRTDAVQEMLDTYEKGTQAGERGLMQLSPDFATRMREGTRIEEAVSILGRDAVPALYWRSVNLGKWASAKGFATLLSYKDEVRAIMTRCLELDPFFFYAGPHRYFGAFYGRAPSFAGGDLTKSREHFEQSIQHSPNYFATRVLFAMDYARKAEDRSLFEEQLNFVLNNDPNTDPAVTPENQVEQRKARDLMAQVNDFFE
jgi:tetratricopeptide (TPR) repeat protein